MEFLSCEGRLRTLGLFRLRKTELQDDLRSDFQYLKRVYRKAREGFFLYHHIVTKQGGNILS